MNTLSLPNVAKKAPAAAPRKHAKNDGLIDTAAFLRHVRSNYDMVPVVVVQGKRHEDSRKAKAKDGRHLVAASRPDGVTFFLLNSHFKDRRAHVGVGIQRNESLLIGPSMAVQRWKGIEEPVKYLATRFRDVSRAVKAFDDLRLTDREIGQFAKRMSSHGYMPGVEARPVAKALIDGLTGSKALDVGCHIIGRMRAGNLAAVGEGRRIKRIRRPDGLFYAGLVAFDHLMSLAHEHGKIAETLSFGALKERLIRS